MNKEQAKKRIKQLKKELNHHRHLYHVQDKQEISDAAWDSLKHELKKIENEYPELITPDSPTQRVGGDPLKKFEKVHHVEPMLSVDDIFEFQELEDWEKYMKEFLRKKEEKENLDFNYYCERKIDGVDIVLTYKKGVLKKGATRGNGVIGENVTQNIKTIEAIPLKLQKPVDVVVRGEIFMRKKDFINLNKKRVDQELPIYANPRNVAAGSVRQLNPKITAERALDCFIFEIITNLGQKTHAQVHEKLKELGFKTDSKTKLCSDLEEVDEYYKNLLKKREKSSFEYDGVAVVLNDISLQKKLGTVGRSPRWMRAYKFPGQQATTVVKDIVVQIGRTGALTPVAKLEPVPLVGSTVSRATLHNQDEIDRLGVRIGDTVVIEKAGDIIPAVVKVLKNMRTGKEKKFKMPKKCPFCQGEIKRKKGEVAHYCLNKNCFAIQKEKIKHFVSKKCFDIEGLGDKIVVQLMEEGLIKDPADIFTLKKGDLEPLERFAEKSADNLIKAINQSKKISFPRFIQSLGIRYVGEQTAIVLAKNFKDSTALSKASQDELINLPDLGPKVSQSIFNWFNNLQNKSLLKKLSEVGVEIENPLAKSKKGTLSDKRFVFTGSLKSMTREEAKSEVQKRGGLVASQVSSKIDYLVQGKEPGSKLTRAQKKDIKVLNEQKFLKMLK